MRKIRLGIEGLPGDDCNDRADCPSLEFEGSIEFEAIEMGDPGTAFVKGGVGCLVVFVVLAFGALLFGGSAHLDCGGAVILFVIGGVIGLVVNWIYQRGRSDAEKGNDDLNE